MAVDDDDDDVFRNISNKITYERRYMYSSKSNTTVTISKPTVSDSHLALAAKQHKKSESSCRNAESEK